MFLHELAGEEEHVGMSSESSPQREPQALTEERDGVDSGWEDVATLERPNEPDHPPPKHESTKQLCGYLLKQSQKGPLKVWKTRWFVFDDQKCCLFYSNHKKEPIQGKIDISTATLTYDVENLSKNQFEIMSEGKVTSIQASSNEIMVYWLTALQKKRRKFSSRRNRAIMMDNTQKLNTVSSREGLISDETSPLIELDPIDDLSLPVPVDLQYGHTSSSRRSWIPKFRPPSFGSGTGSPNSPRRGGQTQNTAPSQNFNRISENSPEPLLNDATSDGIPQYSAASDLVTPPLRSNRLSGKNFTNRLSFLVNRGGRLLKHESCPNCQKAQENISYLENELSIKEREVKDRDEINDFLRNEIRLGDLREKVKEELTVPTDCNEKRVDVLLQREQTIQELQRLLESVTAERDDAWTELKSKEEELKGLREQVDLFKEAVVAKDHVVVELTNQIFQLEHRGEIPIDPRAPMMPQTNQELEDQLQKTKEALDAYKHQNQFLSSEIVELNAIRNEETEAFKITNSKLHELDANFCKVQSKYMILLQETQEPKLGADAVPNSELVSQMLEEALEGDDMTSVVNRQRSNSYDDYGFNRTYLGTEKEIISNPLVAKARRLDHQARSAESAIDEALASHKAKWENYMATLLEDTEIQRSDNLKTLIRGGIPQEYRTEVWKRLIINTVGKSYEKGKYNELLEQNAGKSSVAVNQIELDLLRTLPTNKYYDKPDAQGINKLRRVLVSFSWFDPVVGYCQGLNRLAAIALLFLNEEYSFWCLVAIVHHLLPRDYYSRTLLGSQTDQRVLRDLLQVRSPKLSQHLSFCEIDFCLITFNWFHTIYVDNLPIETMLRIWDTFLYEGSKVLFRFALAIFKYNEDLILQATTSIGIFNHLRVMSQNLTDIDRLVQIGFNEVRHLSKRWIEARRNHHRVQLKTELEQLDSLRAQSVQPHQHLQEDKNHNVDLISFDSKEDFRNSGEEVTLVQVDSASDLEAETET